MSLETKINLPVKPMPRLGVGTWHGKAGEAGEAALIEIVYEAIKSGYRLIDTAAFYQCEPLVGQGIKKAIDEKLCTREDLYVITKLWNCYHGKDEVEPALKRSLKDLQLDYVDQYLMHWPIAVKHIPIDETYPPPMTYDEVPITINETWTAMEACVDKGLCKTIGVSNFELQLLKELLKTCRIKPVANQIEIHPYFQQAKLVEYCAINEIAVTAYSAFGGTTFVEYGVVSDQEVLPPSHPVIKELAAAKGCSPHQLILTWVLHLHPITSVIPRTSRPANLKNNMDAFNIKLTKEDMDKIAKLENNRRFNDMRFWVPMSGHVFGN